jgi:hypothetical protein
MPDKFPVNGTGCALLQIEQTVQVCDATMHNSKKEAWLQKEIIS